jgi:hypothetical protein
MINDKQARAKSELDFHPGVGDAGFHE